MKNQWVIDGITYTLNPETDLYTTDKPIVWEIGYKGSGLFLKIPPSFQNDGPSIPWLLEWLIHPHDTRYFKASRIHDYYLDKGWSRVSAAGEFYSALIADHVPKYHALAMFLGVFLWTVLKRNLTTVRPIQTTSIDKPIPRNEALRMVNEKALGIIDNH